MDDKKKKFQIYRYSNTIIEAERMPFEEMLKHHPAAARIMAWLLDQHLHEWHARKKKKYPGWYHFSVTRMSHLLNLHPTTVRHVLPKMEEHRWIRRRYRYTRGRRGCLLFLHVVLPDYKFSWEKTGEPQKGSMPSPPLAFEKNARYRVVAGKLQRGLPIHPLDDNPDVRKILERWESTKRIIPIGKYALNGFDDKAWRTMKLAAWGLPPVADK